MNVVGHVLDVLSGILVLGLLYGELRRTRTKEKTVMSKGWECPRCGHIYGPTVATCNNPDCKRRPAKPTGRDKAGADLHTALYEESINEFDDGSWDTGGGSGEDE